MFKNVKNNNEVEYVEKEELEDTEKTYKYHIKIFDGKLAEQQKKIEEIVDFISAKFGEDCLDSDINNQVKEIEKNVSDLEEKFKKYIEDNSDILRTEVDKKNRKFYDEIENINDVQTKFYEKYFAELENNEKQINELKEQISQKDLQVVFLETKLDDFIKKNEEYKNTIKEEFKDTDKKIDKINYMGITRKFEKMLKDKYKSNDNEIDEIKKSLTSNFDDLKNLIDINESSTSDKFNIILEKELPEIKQNTLAIYSDLKDKSIQNKNNIENILKDLQKNEDIINSFNAKLKAQSDSISNSEKNLNLKIGTIKSEVENTLNNNKENLQNVIKQLKQDIKQENIKANLNSDGKFKKLVEATKTAYGKLDNKIKEENASLKEIVNLNKNAITMLKNSMQQDSVNTIQKIENTENYINNFNQNINELNQNINSLEEKYIDLNQNINGLEEKYTDFEKLKTDFEQNKVDNEKNDNNFKIIEKTINDIKSNFDKSINDVKKEVVKIKEDTNKIKSQEKTNINTEEFSKNYNQYVKKVESVVEKLNKSIANIQEQNKEQNKNLQLKIKAYIDNRNTSTINQLKETINKLNLSIVEKEKAQKIEMEEVLNKKIKEIQKENERILKKKIEELSNQMRNNFNEYNQNNISLIDDYKPTKRGRKKIYDPVDDSINLKQTASNNKKLDMPKENKSQVLKFFFDDDDDIN